MAQTPTPDEVRSRVKAAAERALDDFCDRVDRLGLSEAQVEQALADLHWPDFEEAWASYCEANG